jgi:hypothetical protein
LLSVQPKDGEGLDCDWSSPDCGIAANRPLVFRFDRWLLPSTATRQSISLAIDQSSYGVFTEPTYDLLRRQITYYAGSGLVPGQVYVLKLADAEQDPSGFGFAAYDGRSPEPKELFPRVFRAGHPSPDFQRVTRAAVNCHQALAAFRDAGCASKKCHQGGADPRPAAGLSLGDRSGVSQAVGRIARTTDRAPQSGRVSVQPQRFGLNMALITPKESAYSLLMYRMLVGKDAYRDVQGRLTETPPSDKEFIFAQTWFGVSGPMPPEDVGFPSGISPIEQVSKIDSWIRDGADLEHCDP